MLLFPKLQTLAGLVGLPKGLLILKYNQGVAQSGVVPWMQFLSLELRWLGMIGEMQKFPLTHEKALVVKRRYLVGKYIL